MSGVVTKRALALSFKELLQKRPLNQITVGDIAENAGINRQTFYYHFPNVTQLVEWICVENAKVALKNNRTYNTWEEGFLSIFDLLKEDRCFVMNIYNHAPTDLLYRYLYQLVYPLMYSVVDEKAKGYKVNESDKRFIADFYKYSFVGLVLDWVQHGMDEDPKTIIRRVSALIHGTIEQGLSNLQIKKRNT